MICIRFCARATWVYVLEIVYGAVRRLSKISNCAFEWDYFYYYYYTFSAVASSHSSFIVMINLFIFLFARCPSNRQSPIQFCVLPVLDNFMCCHNEIEITDPTCCVPSSHSILTPGQPVLVLTPLCQMPGRVAKFIHGYDLARGSHSKDYDDNNHHHHHNYNDDKNDKQK